MIAVRAMHDVGRKVTGGQLGGNEDMVQPGTVIVGSVVEGEVWFGGTSQGTIKKGSEGSGQNWPVIIPVMGAEAGPVLRRVRTTVPITSNESKPKGIEGEFVDGVEKMATGLPNSRGVHIRDRKSTATDRHLGTDETTFARKCVREKSVGRMEQEANIMRPHGWASPDLRPKGSSLIRGIGFLKADNICLAFGTKKIIKSAAGIIITDTRTVKGTYR